MPAADCSHVETVTDGWPPLAEQACPQCVALGSTWVSLRRCLSCGAFGCCDSSPNRHATAHHRATGHPVMRSMQPAQDWVWCYIDELSMRRTPDGWRVVDLFYEVGLGYLKEHVAAGGTADVDQTVVGHGFPLGVWAAEMRRRRSAGELDDDQRRALEDVPGWRWEA